MRKKHKPIDISMLLFFPCTIFGWPAIQSQLYITFCSCKIKKNLHQQNRIFFLLYAWKICKQFTNVIACVHLSTSFLSQRSDFKLNRE